MVFDIPQHGVQAVANLCGAASSEGRPQRRILPNVSPAESQNVIFELWNGTVILKVERPIRIVVRGTGDSVRGTFHVDSIGAEFQTVILRDGLPRNTPIGSQSTNIEGESCPGVGLSSAKMLGTVDRASYIQMFVPHTVSAETCHILGQRTVDNSLRER